MFNVYNPSPRVVCRVWCPKPPQAKLAERISHIFWQSAAAISDPLRGLPACHVVGAVANGQILRKAAVARGVDPVDLPLGIPAEEFID